MLRRFEVVADVFVEVEAGSVTAKVMDTIQQVDRACEALMNMPYRETGIIYDEAYNAINKLVCKVEYDIDDPCNPYDSYKEIIKESYWKLYFCNHDAYKKYAMADFLEYEGHMNEPDFNWNYYSDWHKDIYGYRPR